MCVCDGAYQENFCDALLGMITAARRPRRGRHHSGWRKAVEALSVSAPDVTALLIDFLSEALVLMHTEREAYLDALSALMSAPLKRNFADMSPILLREDIKQSPHEADVKREGRNMVY